MAEGLIYRCVFIFNFLHLNYFSFLDVKEYFSRTPVSYMYTHSIELVPRFGSGSLPSPHSDHSLNNFSSISVQFFSPNGPSFFLSMIHQVIWTSPGTLVQSVHKGGTAE